MGERDTTPAERLQTALDLFDLSVRMFRQRLAREGKSAEEIEALVQAWMAKRPGAEHGDAEGRPVAWPRR
ncbi:MAG: hypothetical protein RIT81_17620 [Deltaproteobacteria bacterium]